MRCFPFAFVFTKLSPHRDYPPRRSVAVAPLAYQPIITVNRAWFKRLRAPFTPVPFQLPLIRLARLSGWSSLFALLGGNLDKTRDASACRSRFQIQ